MRWWNCGNVFCWLLFDLGGEIRRKGNLEKCGQPVKRYLEDEMKQVGKFFMNKYYAIARVKAHLSIGK